MDISRSFVRCGYNETVFPFRDIVRTSRRDLIAPESTMLFAGDNGSLSVGYVLSIFTTVCD